MSVVRAVELWGRKKGGKKQTKSIMQQWSLWDIMPQNTRELSVEKEGRERELSLEEDAAQKPNIHRTR